MVARPWSDSEKWEKIGEKASASSRLSSREEAMYTTYRGQYG